MHIVEGVLSAPVLLTGVGVSAAGVGLGLRRIGHNEIPRVAILASAFFAASLFHVPLGPVSAHLVLNGVMGLLLGWAVFPALLVALLLQWLIFGFGGLLVLGTNTAALALPGVLCHYLLSPLIRKHYRARITFGLGFAAGAVAIMVAALLTALAMHFSHESLARPAELLLIGHVPIIVFEGIVTGFAVLYLQKVAPELFTRPATVGSVV